MFWVFQKYHTSKNQVLLRKLLPNRYYKIASKRGPEKTTLKKQQQVMGAITGFKIQPNHHTTLSYKAQQLFGQIIFYISPVNYLANIFL